MLKAIITVLDENDRILQANRLIFESNCKPITFGTEHEFNFKVVTTDDDLLDKFYKELNIEIKPELYKADIGDKENV